MIDVNESSAEIHARERAQLHALTELAADGIVFTDENGLLQDFNPACSDLFGYALAEVVGRDLQMLMPEFYSGERDPEISGIAREFLGRRKDGSTFPLEISVAQIELDGHKGCAGIIRDISDRKISEQNLQQSNAQLESALGKLKATQVQLIQSEKLVGLGELSAGLAHELNTPIGVAVTASSHLRSEAVGVRQQFDEETLSAEALERYIKMSQGAAQIILNNMQRAGELVRNFRNVSADQIRQGQRKFNLQDVLNELIGSLQPHLRRSPVKISVESSNVIVMDSFPGAISQVMTNLIFNSLKHGFDEGQSGDIKIVLSRFDDLAEISFSDTGQGIAPDLIERIFEPFVSGRPDSGGAGLGLYIVRSLVTENLGGTIEVSSTLEEGVSFKITLPVDLH